MASLREGSPRYVDARVSGDPRQVSAAGLGNAETEAGGAPETGEEAGASTAGQIVRCMIAGRERTTEGRAA